MKKLVIAVIIVLSQFGILANVFAQDGADGASYDTAEMAAETARTFAENDMPLDALAMYDIAVQFSLHVAEEAADFGWSYFIEATDCLENVYCEIDATNTLVIANVAIRYSFLLATEAPCNEELSAKIDQALEWALIGGLQNSFEVYLTDQQAVIEAVQSKYQSSCVHKN